MRQAVSLILMFILAGVVSAGTVRITLEDAGNQRLRVGYEVTSGSTLPVGFGLDITLSNEATFQSVVSTSSHFPIYPGTVVITGGEIVDYGTPVVPGGLGTSDVTIEMGVQGNPLQAPSDPRDFNADTMIDNMDLAIFVQEWLVYDGPSFVDLNADDLINFRDYGLFVDSRYDAPPMAMGELLLLGLAGNGAITTTVSISDNLIYGGIVNSKDVDFDVILPDPITVIVPEPATFFLLGLGVVKLRRRGGRKINQMRSYLNTKNG